MSEAIASKAERLAAYNANIAAAEKDPSLSPETGKPLSKMNAARFGAGFLVFGVLWMSGLGIVSAVLLPMHYKTIPGVNADALVGIVNAFTAVASLVANLMFGNFSDRSRSRFGRRTPWILFGAVLGGVTLFLTGTTHNAVLLTIFYCACMFGLNCMIAPMVAILSDRVPSKIRGTMSAFYGAGSTIGAPIGTMLGALFIENLIPGFAVAGVLMFLGGVVAVIIIPKEQSADFLPKDEGSAKDILSSFRPPKFSTAHDFYKAFAGRFCMLMAYQMINVYQLYIIQNYIGQSVKESAVTVSVVSMIMMVMSLVGSFISGPVSDLIGRRKVPVVVASVLFAVGIALATGILVAYAEIPPLFATLAMSTFVYGFGRAHHRVLHFVQRRPGLTIAELLDILQITKQSLNRVLKELIETGFVEQRTGIQDKRQRHLHVLQLLPAR